MISTKARRRWSAVHRWLTIVLTPVFVPILLSAVMLALLPLFGGEAAAPSRIDPAALTATLAKVDPAGKVQGIEIGADGRTVTLRNGEAFDIATAEPVTAPETDPEAYWLRLHKSLGGFGDGLVKIASLAMTLLVVSGPLLAKPRFRNSVMGWHLAAGWVLLPLVALTPVTGVMLALHIGTPAPVSLARSSEPVPVVEAMRAVAAAGVDLGGLRSVALVHGAIASVEVRNGGVGQRYVVDGARAVTAEPPAGWVKAVHEGSWAEPWSRLLNVGSVLALAFLNLTGLWSWLRRMAARLRRNPVVA